MTTRIAHLVRHYGERPESILAVTFTNKATSEMRSRVEKLLGDKARGVWVATFHSAALRILRSHAHLLGYTKDFAVYDEQDSRAVMRSVLKEMGLGKRGESVGQYLKFVDRTKNAYEEPSLDCPSSKYAYNAAEMIKAYQRYQELLFSANAMDFGDLLVNVVNIFAKFPEVLSSYQRILRFFLVDEFQDTNKVQYLFIRQLSSCSRNLLVVGDDDQSIYRFRGASISNILNFEVDFPGAKVVKLEQNYRSTATIIEAGQRIIEKNRDRKDKRLWTENELGQPILCFGAEDENEEAAKIIAEIQRVIAQGSSLSDVAIFYRTNAQSRALEDALLAAKIAYRIYGALRFYERREIKDVLAFLRVSVNPQDWQSFLRVINVPSRGIGPKAIQDLERARSSGDSYLEAARKLAKQHSNSRSLGGFRDFVSIIDSLRAATEVMKLDQLVEEVLRLTGYADKLKVSSDPEDESRLENLRELKSIGHQSVLRSMAAGIDSPLEQLRNFLDGITLAAGVEESSGEGGASPQESEREAVSLMTLHLAKGLEFKTVFFSGFEEGLVPHHRSIEDAAFGDLAALEEERRLCYVGITRAKEQLYLTSASYRGMMAGAGGYSVNALGERMMSRFRADIPRKLIREVGGRSSWQSSQKFSSGVEGEFAEKEDSHNIHYTRGDASFPRGLKGVRETGSEEVIGRDKYGLPGGPWHRRSSKRKLGSPVRELGSSQVITADQLDAGDGVNPSGELKCGHAADISAWPRRQSASGVGDCGASQERRSALPSENVAILEQLNELAPGVRVRHELFGDGTIVGIEGLGRGSEADSRVRLVVDFDGKGQMRIVALNAPISVIRSECSA